MSEASMIEPGLWVGGQPDIWRFPKEIQAVINLRREMSGLNYPHQIQGMLWLPIEDADFPGVWWLHMAADAVRTFREKPWNTLVHCHAGISRSVMVTAAYLMKYDKHNLAEALSRIQRARPIADPNRSFRAGLAAFEKDVYKGNGG